jgi:hypothetical protein
MPIGGGTPTLLASVSGVPGVAVRGVEVFVADSAKGTIQRLNPGSNSLPVTLIAEQRGPRGVAVSGHRMFWFDDGSGPGFGTSYFPGQTTAGQGILSAPTDASGPPSPVACGESVRWMVVDEQRVYYMTQSGSLRRLSR